MRDLQMEFKNHCDDYMEEIEPDKKSLAVDFCNKVIFIIGPESHKLKHRNADMVWKFRFPKAQDEHIVFIVNHKRENAQCIPKNDAKSMTLTVQQASLLALETFSRLIKVFYDKGDKLMTPLADACFCKCDTSSLAEELGITELELLVKLNQNTIRGGQYLTNPDVDIAICSTISATRNTKDENLKKRILNNVVKQYRNKNFVADHSRIAIISKYANEGLPRDFVIKDILKDIESRSTEYRIARRSNTRGSDQLLITD